MLVAWRTLEILALLSALGLPFTLLLLSPAEFDSKRGGVSARILLAPVTGLAVFAISSSAFAATGLPLNGAVWPFWIVLSLVWMALLLYRRHSIMLSMHVLLRSRPHHAWRYAAVVAGLLMTLSAYLWPFFREPELVMWHYAGTDVYFYIQAAEHIGKTGLAQIPVVSTYQAAPTFFHFELVNIQASGQADKPGTFRLFAGMAETLGLLPHEVFSPLCIAVIGLFFLSVTVLAMSAGLPLWVASITGTVSALGPAIWLLVTYTFLGNLLALPFLPLVVLLPRPGLTLRTGIYGGIIFGALIWVYNYALLPVLAMPGPYLLLLGWRAFRTATLRAFIFPFVILLITALILISAMLGPLLKTPMLITLHMFFRQTTDAAADGATAGVIRPLPSWNWIWPAFNLNQLPPQPLKEGELPFVVALALLAVLYVGLGVWRRRTDSLWFATVNLIIVVLVASIGAFRSDYELFRIFAIFTFIPVLMLFSIPNVVSPQRLTIMTYVSSVIVLVMVGKFLLNDYSQFRYGLDNQLSDTRYSMQNMVDRSEMQRLSSGRTIVLGSETPTFTAFTNVLMMLSSTQLGVPNHFYRFIFYDEALPPDRRIAQRDVQYGSELVVRNLRYADIFELERSRPLLYQSTDLAVAENDLVPFFDNDSFPPLSVFPATRSLPVGRTLSKRTDVFLFNQHESTIHVELEGDPSSPPIALRYALDGGESATVERTADGHFVFPPVRASQGLHKLVLEPTDGPVVIKRMNVWR